MPLLARFMDFNALASGIRFGAIAPVEGFVSTSSTTIASTHFQQRPALWSSSSAPQASQSTLSRTPEQWRQAGCSSIRPGRTPSCPQAQVPLVRFAC
jgi:hypothetical protein